MTQAAPTRPAPRAFRKNVATPTDVRCPYCGQQAQCVGGDAIYPHRPDLAHKKFWQCEPCNAYVGCHPHRNAERGGQGDGTVPMGRLANYELRRLKKLAHAAFDPLFRSANSMTRRDAYAWLAGALGIKREECHIGMFDDAQCRAVLAAVEAREATQV